jgi:Skp family chaperone for outer membrane proteins
MRQQSLEQEIQAYNEELNKPILERIQKSIEIVADRKKLNYVMDESVTLYFKGGIDCTAEVMVEMLRLDAEALKK